MGTISTEGSMQASTIKIPNFLERLLDEGEFESILLEIQRVAEAIDANQDLEQMKSFIRVLADKRDIKEVKGYSLL